MLASRVGQHFGLRPNFALWKRGHYPIISTGMRYNIKGRWLATNGESFHGLLFTLLYLVETVKIVSNLVISNDFENNGEG